MTEFAEFVRGFCLIAVAGGLMLIAAPDGKLKKHVKFVLSICMVCALLSAFLSFSENASELFGKIGEAAESNAQKNQAEIYLDVAKTAKKNMEAELRSLLCTRLEEKESGIYVVVQIDTEDLSAVEITGISVFLDDMEKAEEAQSYLDEMFMGSVKINIMKKGE
jgi:hypothetical protein